MGPLSLSRILTMILLLLLVLSSPVTVGQQRFLDQPWDVTVVAGDKVRSVLLLLTPHLPPHPQITLPCVVQSKKGLLQWTKDGFGLGLLRELPGYPRYRMVGEEERGEWGLEINSVSSADDGVYQCQAE